MFIIIIIIIIIISISIIITTTVLFDALGVYYQELGSMFFLRLWLG